MEGDNNEFRNAVFADSHFMLDAIVFWSRMMSTPGCSTTSRAGPPIG